MFVDLGRVKNVRAEGFEEIQGICAEGGILSPCEELLIDLFGKERSAEDEACVNLNELCSGVEHCDGVRGMHDSADSDDGQ